MKVVCLSLAWEMRVRNRLARPLRVELSLEREARWASSARRVRLGSRCVGL